MDEWELAESLRRVREGSLDRRQFARTLLGLGLTAPMVVELLGPRPGHAQARRSVFTPTRRGGGGELKTLWWQAPTILNPHLATGAKDADASRIFYEGLVSFDPDGTIVPNLTAEIPTIENGGVARDGLSIIVKVKKGVQWHDGKPFTADDVVFTWEYIMDPATAATTSGAYRDIARIDKLDSHTVKIGYKNPNPFWPKAFSSIIPRHVFAPFKGARSREAPSNLKPVGTGPYRVVDFKPGDLVRAEINSKYHVANRPFFDAVELKGGGDAVSTARAVLQTGEYDFAFGLQVEDEILRRLEQVGKGRLIITPGSAIEHIQCNFADPWKEADGERSSVKVPHALLTD